MNSLGTYWVTRFTWEKSWTCPMSGYLLNKLWIVLTLEWKGRRGEPNERAHCSPKGHFKLYEKVTLCSWRAFWMYMDSKFSKFQALTMNKKEICSANISPSHSIRQNWLHGHWQMWNCLWKSLGCSNRGVRAAGCFKNVEKDRRGEHPAKLA